MDITPLIARERQVIQSYGDAGFKINGALHASSVLVFPDHAEDWPLTAFSEITVESLRSVTERADVLDILLIGGGSQFQPVPPEVKQHFRKLNIAVESMDTGAACRTYNILLAEERRVAAALLHI